LFTVKNKIKISSIALISFSVCSILTVFIGLNFIHTEDAKIIYIVAVGAFYNVLRLLTFLPIYGAKCLDFKITTFYPTILKNVFSVVILSVLAIGISLIFSINTWIKLFAVCVVIGVVGLVVNIFILFNKDERNENLQKEYCPDYEIKEWNEDNFDLNSNIYVKQAYESRKYAFVTDYVRLYALYNEGRSIHGYRCRSYKANR